MRARLGGAETINRAKQYKTRLKKWKFDVKNVNGGIMLRLARMRAQRKYSDKKDSSFRVAKKDVSEQKIDRYLKRNGISTDQPSDIPSPEGGNASPTLHYFLL